MKYARKQNSGKNTRSIKTKVLPLIWCALMLIFFLTAGVSYFYQRNSMRQSVERTLCILSAQKTQELNAQFSIVERLVQSLERHIIADIDEDRIIADAEYGAEYLEGLSQTLSNTAQLASGVAAVYFRLEAERFGSSSGTFLISSPSGDFISVKPTDIQQFHPDDTEHVGWYYAPIWNGGPVWTEPYENRNINIHMISYVAPVYHNGTLLGVVGMDINMAVIKNILTAIPADNAFAMLAGQNANLIYQEDYPMGLRTAGFTDDLRALYPLFMQAAQGNGGIRSFDWNGKKHAGILSRLENGMVLTLALPLSIISKSRWFMLLQMSVLFVLVLIISSITVHRILRKIIYPISELTEASYKLSRGELGISIAYTSDNEIGVLADSIRKMAEQLREYIDYIREQAKSEREAKETALGASRAKSDFLANMSHEIRTPINAMLGMNEMILRETDSTDIRQYASNIKNAGNTLVGIVNEILDFSKIEAGKMELLPDQYDLSSVLVDIVTIISERAQKKGLEFILKANPDMPKMLFGDSMRIKQCAINLLTNAVKYTPQGSVTFSVDYYTDGRSGIMLTVSVADTGIGIKQEDMEKLFSPFDRIEEDRNKTIEGTGLGMSIVQKLLAMMGSRLDVQSEYEKGSVFSFAVRQETMSDEKLGDIMEEYRRSVAEIQTYQEKLFAPKARLLFVDDTEMNLSVIKGLLKNTKIQIDTAESGFKTLKKVCEKEYDILFIDHRMPGMDGIETLQAMKTLIGNKCTGKPCIALTANAIAGAREMYLEAGFNDYLTKPVIPEKLERMIRKYLPPELIDSADSASQEGTAQEKAGSFAAPEGIDADAALANCGSTDLLRDMLSQFYEAIPANTQELQALVEQGDTAGFRIKVHALKSTSRLIGALELSEKAARLEAAADSGDTERIAKDTPPLLELYGSYRQRLADFAAQDTAQLPPVPAELLQQTIDALRNAIDDFDIDGVDSCIAELDKYAMPEYFKDTFEAIRSCATNVDFSGLAEHLSELKTVSQGE